MIVRVCCDGETTWNPAEDEHGGVAVQTALLCTLRTEETLPEPLPAEEQAGNEPEPAPPQLAKREPSKERRHLAGANWLDDWTLYFPAQKKSKHRRTPKK